MCEAKVERGARAAKQILLVFTQVPSKKACSRKFVSSDHTAGCNEVDPSGLLLGVQYGVQYLRGTVIFRVSLPKKHPGAREVAWSNITAKRYRSMIAIATGLLSTNASKYSFCRRSS